jgi:hypothetical protein
MDFIRKALRLIRPEKQTGSLRGMAPIQSQEEQDQTRTRMEAEMALQKERRETPRPGD